MGVPLAPSVQSPSAWGKRATLGGRLNPTSALEIALGAAITSTAYPVGDPRRQASLYPNRAYVDFDDVPTWINSTAPGGSFSVPGDRTAVYVLGRRVRLFGLAGGSCDVRIVASSFGSGVTTINVTTADVGGAVPTDLIGVTVQDTLPAVGGLTHVVNVAGSGGPTFANTDVSATGAASLVLANLSPDVNVSAALAVRVTSGNFTGKFLNAHGGITGRGVHIHTGFPVAIEVGVGDQPRCRFNTITNPNIMYGSEEALRLVAYRESDNLGGSWLSFFRYDEVTRKGSVGFSDGGTNNTFTISNEEAGANIKIVANAGHLWLAPGAGKGIYLDAAAGIAFFSGTGSPNGVVTANIGCLYSQSDAASAGFAFWIKGTGAGNTGWVRVSGVT